MKAVPTLTTDKESKVVSLEAQCNSLEALDQMEKVFNLLMNRLKDCEYTTSELDSIRE